MNLCDDLNRLADTTASKQISEQAFIGLCDELDDMIREDYNVWFTKPMLVALLGKLGRMLPMWSEKNSTGQRHNIDRCIRSARLKGFSYSAACGQRGLLWLKKLSRLSYYRLIGSCGLVGRYGCRSRMLQSPAQDWCFRHQMLLGCQRYSPSNDTDRGRVEERE